MMDVYNTPIGGENYGSNKSEKSSLEMLRLSCEQLQAKSPPLGRNLLENKTNETICSQYDKMSETEALTMLKKKVMKDTTHCHLWMFLFDILMDTNKANVATWEDQKGMFRIRDPTRLADMWGEKRNRTNMTYEKLSRSLRHYYEKKILRKVPKRKYTYKFNSREILKSYEVQPFYRRSNANSHRNNQNQQNYKQQLSSSGQSSPFTPVTPLTPVTPSSNYQQTSHFQWPQVSTYQNNWTPVKQEPGTTSVSQPSPVHLPPTPSISPLSQQVSPLNNANGYILNHASHHQQQHQQTQQQFVPMEAWNQQCFYPLRQTQTSQFPCGEANIQQQYVGNMIQVTMATSSSYQPYPPINSHPHHHSQQMINCKSGMEDSKASVQHEINQLQEMLEKPKCHTKPAQLTLNIPSVSNHSSYCASPILSTQRSRSQSIDSYVSTSPDSFMESDDIFNDIVDSLLLDAF